MGSPAFGFLFAQRVVIGVGDLAVSNNEQTVLTTYALGSCVGVVAYDAAVRVGGILHVMLPDSKIAPEKAAVQPAMFADTGMALFLRQMATFRAAPERVQFFLAGGARVILAAAPFRIGERNAHAVLLCLADRGFRPVGTDLGGSVNRTLHLELETGRLIVKAPDGDREHLLAG